MGNNQYLRSAHQRGSVMVEMAVVLPLFLALVFAIMEFSIAVFNWSLVGEATRAGARFAVVNNPACGGVTAMSCPGAAPISCSPSVSSPLLAEMKKLRPSLTGANVSVSYACSDTGESGRIPPLLNVTVETTGIVYHFIVPTLLGISPTVTIPAFATTRVSEDLYSTP
ncbi:MAG: pilus assembly protein [Mariprofundus sp.]